MWENNAQNILVRNDSFIAFTQCSTIEEAIEFNSYKNNPIDLSNCEIKTINQEWWHNYINKIKYKNACLQYVKSGLAA